MKKQQIDLIKKYFASVDEGIEIFCIKLQRCPSFFLQEKVNLKDSATPPQLDRPKDSQFQKKLKQS
jgi:hypothetical protein